LGAGTPIWTGSGLQPVETIRAGDQILTQDTATGALAFAPVLSIRHSTRQPVKTIAIAEEPIVVTDLERFWVSGKGWVMALGLKPGDAIRALGRSARVTAIEGAATRLVAHVEVAAGRGIIVGKRGVLAHDDRMAFPAGNVFDTAEIAEEHRP
jgi:hypothetical protein